MLPVLTPTKQCSSPSFFSRAKEDESNPEQTRNPVILHVRDPAKLNSGTERQQLNRVTVLR